MAGLFFAVSSQLDVANETESPMAAAGFQPVKPDLPYYYHPNIKCWTDWFDRDDPSGTGDWETLMHLRDEYPGRICCDPVDIEAQPVYGGIASPPNVIYKSDTSYGFICRNGDQSSGYCQDYRVRFSCSLKYCSIKRPVCWTQWFDRDNPNGTGDWETVVDLKKQYPKEMCNYPLYIEAVTTDTLTPAVFTGEAFY
ncbi:hypothetical protein LDENG_00039580, partial [Lucifuga dentata]